MMVDRSKRAGNRVLRQRSGLFHGWRRQLREGGRIRRRCLASPLLSVEFFLRFAPRARSGAAHGSSAHCSYLSLGVVTSKIMFIILVSMSARLSSLNLTDAEVAWLKSLTLSDPTSAAYRGEMGRLIAYCASTGVLEVRQLKAKHWIAYLSCLTTDRTAISPQAKPLKPSSAVQAVRITRSFLNRPGFCGGQLV